MYGLPVVGLIAGENVAGPNPVHTGMFGLMLCVRSMYVARLSVWS